jgi:hypothetical protein
MHASFHASLIPLVARESQVVRDVSGCAMPVVLLMWQTVRTALHSSLGNADSRE